MGWININDNFQVYSVREDFMQFFNWGVTFLGEFTLPFFLVCTTILIIVVFLSLATRLKLFKRVIK